MCKAKQHTSTGTDINRQRLTPAPRVCVRVVFVIQVWLVQVPEGLKLRLGILEKAELHQQRQPHKPELKHRVESRQVSYAYQVQQFLFPVNFVSGLDF